MIPPSCHITERSKSLVAAAATQSSTGRRRNCGDLYDDNTKIGISSFLLGPERAARFGLVGEPWSGCSLVGSNHWKGGDFSGLPRDDGAPAAAEGSKEGEGGEGGGGAPLKRHLPPWEYQPYEVTRRGREEGEGTAEKKREGEEAAGGPCDSPKGWATTPSSLLLPPPPPSPPTPPSPPPPPPSPPPPSQCSSTSHSLPLSHRAASLQVKGGSRRRKVAC